MCKTADSIRVHNAKFWKSSERESVIVPPFSFFFFATEFQGMCTNTETILYDSKLYVQWWLLQLKQQVPVLWV